MAVPVISADSHVTEHPDAYRKYVASRERDGAPHVERNDSGNDVYVIPGMKAMIASGTTTSRSFMACDPNRRVHRPPRAAGTGWAVESRLMPLRR